MNKIFNIFKKKEKNHVSKCCNRKEFILDDYLYNQIMSNEAVIFAGAGISTESKNIIPITFYEDVEKELNLLNSNLSFPELMGEYCKLPDGRRRLIQKIQKRFDYIESFSFLERQTTRFYKELATLYPVKTIITTNWDLYFEKYCNAISFITDEDMAFWDSEKRSVLKIHGSISNYGTIIATTDDYKKAENYLHKGLVGSKLKSILAEKNIIFIGYSYRDTDFQEIYNFVKKSIGDFHKQSYIITPFENESKRFEELGFKSIITDGTYFIEEVKKRAIKEKNLLPDKIYDEVEWLLNLLHIEHNKICENINIKEYPHIIYTLAYQDGMIDGLERALNYKSSGEYSHPCYLDRISDMYSKMMDENIKNNGKLEDICYLDGYNLSLLFLVLDKDDRPEIYPPLYSVFGTKNIKNMDDLKKALTIFPSKFKNEYKYAQKLVSGFKDNEIYHHKPFFIQ
ncbi:MAG: SIR2 family protein [Fusobacteriaceae bacterium]|mgnify:CR=1 FL=1|nr:SIR2 family protein [Fusobacteriaceae bacterium]